MAKPKVLSRIDMTGSTSRPTTNIEKIWLDLIDESKELDKELAPLLAKRKHMDDALQALS